MGAARLNNLCGEKGKRQREREIEKTENGNCKKTAESGKERGREKRRGHKYNLRNSLLQLSSLIDNNR